VTHVDLFSGLGGFTLAAHANGIETVQFVEINQQCRNFLSKAWPGVPIHNDIKTFKWDGRPVFLLTAGVPCQPASRAGKQRGKDDNRWLWPEALRVLSEVRPAWAIFENPDGIGDVGLSGILAEVEATGYEVQVYGIPACAVGAPHKRMRYWIVGHAKGGSVEQIGSIRAGQGDDTLGGIVGVDDSGSRKHRAKRFSEAKRLSGEHREALRGGMSCGTDADSQLADDQSRKNHSRGNGNLAEAEGCGRGSDTADRGIGQGQLADDGSEGHQDVQFGSSFPEVRDETHDTTSECTQGDMADTSLGGQRADRGASRDSGHIDECDEGDMADTKKRGGRPGLRNSGQTGERGIQPPDAGFWSNSIWLPCADGKLRRAPDDAVGMAYGLPVELLEELGTEGRQTPKDCEVTRSILAALGNSIVWQVAERIIHAIVEAES
jgi:site-specific DNA-cytosine methylase